MKVNLRRFRWAWTTLGAMASFAVLAKVDLMLKAATGYGTVDLQKVSTAEAFDAIAAAWATRDHAAMAGFNLGFDYLFMPLYGFAFYYSGLIARDAFFANAALRRAMTLAAAIPLVGALFDAAENGLETFMFVHGASDETARTAFIATNVKMVCFYIGLVLLLLAFAALFRKRKAEPA